MRYYPHRRGGPIHYVLGPTVTCSGPSKLNPITNFVRKPIKGNATVTSQNSDSITQQTFDLQYYPTAINIQLRFYTVNNKNGVSTDNRNSNVTNSSTTVNQNVTTLANTIPVSDHQSELSDPASSSQQSTMNSNTQITGIGSGDNYQAQQGSMNIGSGQGSKFQRSYSFSRNVTEELQNSTQNLQNQNQKFCKTKSEDLKEKVLDTNAISQNQTSTDSDKFNNKPSKDSDSISESDPNSDSQQQQQQAQPPTQTALHHNPGVKITLLGCGCNLFLSGIKGIGGLASGSASLLADAAHSLSDLVVDVVTLGTLYLVNSKGRDNSTGGLRRDAEHQFGYSRYEDLGTLMVSTFICAAGVTIGWESLQVLMETMPHTLVGGSVTGVSNTIQSLSPSMEQGLTQLVSESTQQLQANTVTVVTQTSTSSNAISDLANSAVSTATSTSVIAANEVVATSAAEIVNQNVINNAVVTGTEAQSSLTTVGGTALTSASSDSDPSSINTLLNQIFNLSLSDPTSHFGHLSKDRAPIALASIATAFMIKESLYRMTVRIGKKENSAVLLASAWHHRVDALSSVVAGVGIVGSTYLSVPIADSLGGVVIGTMVFKTGFEIFQESLFGLADKFKLDDDMKNSIVKLALSSSRDILAVDENSIRVRRAGNALFVELVLVVSPRLSLSGYRYAERLVQKNVNDGLEDEVAEVRTSYRIGKVEDVILQYWSPEVVLCL